MDPFLIDEDEEEEESTMVKEEGLKHTIYVVDARQSMLEGESLSTAMEGISEALRTLVMRETNEKVSVLLCGVGKSEGEPGNAIFVPLQRPGAKDILSLERLAEGTELKSVFKSLKPSEPLPLDGALTAALSSIRSSATDKDEVDIIIFTNDPDPCKNDDSLHARIVKRVMSDFRQSRHTLASVLLCPLSQEVTEGKLWTDLLREEDESGNLMPSENLVIPPEELAAALKRKVVRKRTYARVPFRLAEGVTMGVGVYHTVHIQNKKFARKVEATTNEELKTQTRWICATTGESLGPHQIRTYISYGGERVPFTPAEKKSVKNILPQGFQLLGFKPRSAVPEENLSSALFLYPEERLVQGSSTLFVALHKKLLEFNKVAIVSGVLRERVDAPHLYAIFPVKASEEAGVYQGNGFYAVKLPYADALRPIVPPSTPFEVPDELVEMAGDIRRRLQLRNFGDELIPNPVLQKQIAHLEAIALERDEVDWDPEKDDYLLPNLDQSSMWPEISRSLEAFHEKIGADEESVPRSTSGAKRAAGGSGGAPKRQRVDAADIDMKEIEAAAKNGKLNKFKVPELKAACVSAGLEPGRVKKDLIEQLTTKFA